MLQEFGEESRLEGLDQEWLTREELTPRVEWTFGMGPSERAEVTAAGQVAASHRDRAALAVDLLAVRTAERHAKAMQGLTWA